MRLTYLLARFSLTLMLISINSLLKAQTAYIIKDSAKIYGVRLVDGPPGSNALIVRVRTLVDTVEYTPLQIKEYGFQDGRVYMSRTLSFKDSSARVFLQKLTGGPDTLFYFRGHHQKNFYISGLNKPLMALPAGNIKNLREMLREKSGQSPQIPDLSKVVHYNKKSISRYMEIRNKNVLRSLPHFKFGVTSGYEFVKLVVPDKTMFDYVDEIEYNYDGSITGGIFADQPLWFGEFSLHSELILSSHSYSYNKDLQGNQLDLLVKTSSLNIPVLLRYTLPAYGFKPFVNAGLIWIYNFKNENDLYVSTIMNDIIEINKPIQNSLIRANQQGVAVGIGFEQDLTVRNSVSLELRYSRLLERDEYIRSIFSLSLALGF